MTHFLFFTFYWNLFVFFSFKSKTWFFSCCCFLFFSPVIAFERKQFITFYFIKNNMMMKLLIKTHILITLSKESSSCPSLYFTRIYLYIYIFYQQGNACCISNKPTISKANILWQQWIIISNKVSCLTQLQTNKLIYYFFLLINHNNIYIYRI